MINATLTQEEKLEKEVTPAQLPTDTTEAPNATAVQQPIKKNQIQVWYHYDDHDLVHALDHYLQPLFRRLGPQVVRNFFGYRKETPKVPDVYTGTNDYLVKAYEKDKAEYEKEEQNYQKRQDYAVSSLKRTFLLIVCVSNAFIEKFWDDLDHNAELSMLMANPDFQIIPVVLRPTETGTYQSRPLCTYEGHHLETACKEIAAVVETIVRQYYGPDLEQKKTPVDMLFQSSTTIQTVIPSQTNTIDVLMERCLSTLTPIQALLEQTSVRVVEAQQLALTSQSTSESELRKQLGEMELRLTALQNASMKARLRRLFRISSNKEVQPAKK